MTNQDAEAAAAGNLGLTGDKTIDEALEYGKKALDKVADGVTYAGGKIGQKMEEYKVTEKFKSGYEKVSSNETVQSLGEKAKTGASYIGEKGKELGSAFWSHRQEYGETVTTGVTYIGEKGKELGSALWGYWGKFTNSEG